MTPSACAATPRPMYKGSCLCGAVHFEADAELHGSDACHCTMCRKTSGHYWVSTNVPRKAFTLHGEENVTWYASSKKVRRGFCKTCGSALFWDPIGVDIIGVAMGAFEKPTNTKLHMHIFVADKGDYYELEDDLPKHDKFPPRPAP